MTINKFTKSAIIGYWRSGARIDQMPYLLGMYLCDIIDVINEYKRKEIK